MIKIIDKILETGDFSDVEKNNIKVMLVCQDNLKNDLDNLIKYLNKNVDKEIISSDYDEYVAIFIR